MTVYFLAIFPLDFYFLRQANHVFLCTKYDLKRSQYTRGCHPAILEVEKYLPSFVGDYFLFLTSFTLGM